MSVAAEVLPALKPFQRRTAEHAFDRLYNAPNSTGRFLVADEVGLGKTMVARGVIAKAIDRLRDEGVKRIDVIYVCSNQVIARQNISKLMVTGEEHDPVLDRVTMLPAHLKDLDEHEINLIPLTPQTSLDLRSNVGARRERVLLWYLLSEHFGEKVMRRRGPKRVLQGPCHTVESFESGLKWDPWQWSDDELDPGLSERFLAALRADAAATGEESMLARFELLADSLTRRDRSSPNAWSLASEANGLVGELRRTLATSCIDGLEPDLVILDEFQRFRNLLSPDDPTGDLARMLFRHQDAKVLLLSATPYKMFTRDIEADEDHHVDFLHTLDFLLDHDEKARVRCAELLGAMRKGFRELPESRDDVLKAKRGLERRLRSVIARTERLAVGGDRNGMVVAKELDGLQLTPADVTSFAELDRVARVIGHPDIVEYWKSAPYPLNFMDDYVFNRDFEQAARKREDARLKRGGLESERVVDFGEIDLGNPRLRALAADTVDRDLWKLLWLPPSMPYYRAGPPFAQFAGTSPPTKRLVFSAWGVVPKAISLLLSYEAERRMVALGEEPRRNTAEDRKAVSQPLRIAKNSERTAAGTMTTFALMVPSIALARLVDPLGSLRDSDGEPPTAQGALQQVRSVLRGHLRELTRGAETAGAEDAAWYAAVPLLLEADRVGADRVIEWLGSDEVLSVITSRGAEESRDSGAWAAHLDRAIEIVRDPSTLGKPPSDLLAISALVALASPGMTAVRALSRVAADGDEAGLRTAALRVADAMRGIFNWPEAVPLIRATDRTTRYWEDALRYCAHGNLQAVLDEFAHVLAEWAPIPGDKSPDDFVTGVSDAMLEALALHGADYEVRRIDGDGVPEDDPLRMRPRFAIRFADPRASEDRQVDRATNVRASFNSPFWPFVLASTSVGQEGLDFHLYCHAIVHWNLPSNPVDFEQREGRVHRYKGHAVRINAAHLHGREALARDGDDPWEAIFDSAEHGDGGLRPYWVLNDGPARIERYVPVLPWSRDSERRRLLEKLLASYRLAFGQPRQDDLIAFLGELDLSEDEVAALTIDLSPRR